MNADDEILLSAILAEKAKLEERVAFLEAARPSDREGGGMTREEMEAVRAAMSQPSKVYFWQVNNTELYRRQLATRIPDRFFISPKDDTQPLMAVYVHEDAVPVAKQIFADEDNYDGMLPMSLSFWDEHGTRKVYGPWPWEAA